MKRCKLLSSCRESFSFLQERRRRKEEEGVGERIKGWGGEEERRLVQSKRARRRGKRDRGLGSGRSREREEARDEWERLGGRGQASSLPGFALLGSSEELRVTDHQTDGADSAASRGTNLSVGMGDHPLPSPPPLPPAPSFSDNLIALQWKWNPYCCRISQSNKLISLDHILGLKSGDCRSPHLWQREGMGQRHVFKWLICFLSSILRVSSLEGIN